MASRIETHVVESRSSRASRTRRLLGTAMALGAVACGLLGLGAGAGNAQDQVRNFTKPILVHNTDGHHAPVRALIVTPDGALLLSAGLDKVVNVWDLRADRPRLARTIRPPIWRGVRGQIYSMALAPTADAQGQRTLAIAGVGVENQGGNIGLYRFPGLANPGTGDLIAFLPSGVRGAPEPQGHTETVTSLAFDPRGTTLASGSNDGSARLWDLAARRVRAVFGGHAGPVRALAFTPDGRRLVTADHDGVVRVWDVTNPAAAPLRSEPRRDPADALGVSINALAISPDGATILVGRENGLEAIRFDGANLGAPRRLWNADVTIEALTLSPDGRRLVTTSAARLRRRSDLPQVDCNITLHDLAGGQPPRVLLPLSNLAYACTFTPDGRTLAVAGGDSQAIYLITDFANANTGLVRLEGQGRSVWDVGFAADNRTIAYARTRPDRPDAPTTYWAFNLTTRRVTSLDRTALSRARTTLDGWSIRPVDLYTLEVVAPGGGAPAFTIRLDPDRDRRWWSYSLIPPGPGHPQPTVAVGCETGVAFYQRASGLRTRFYAGHSGPVYCLAPSPDGRWLVTGSSDQTVRLWTLAGCDTLAPLGAEFGPGAAADERVVTKVEPLGFAEAMGLQGGDVIEKYVIGDTFLTPEEFFARVGSVRPNTPIQFQVRRTIEVLGLTFTEGFPVNTTKRDAPALSFFPGLNGEWVLWMPRGYYDTSIAGDRRFLGWHINPPRLDPPRPTDYLAIEQFEREMRRPDLLNRLIETADLLAVLTGPPPAGRPAPAIAERDPADQVLAAQPPDLAVDVPGRPATGPMVVEAANLPVSVVATSPDRQPIDSIQYKVGGLLLPEIQLIPPRVRFEDRAVLPLGLGRQVISVIARNVLGKQRVVRFEVQGQAPPKQPPRLVVLSIGVGRFQPSIPPIASAERDAKDLGPFLAAQLVDPGRRERFGKDRARLQVFADAEMGTTGKIGDAFAVLDADLKAARLGAGDVVVLVLESHVLTWDKGCLILAADTVAGAPPAPALPAADVADLLGRLSSYGCTVVLLLDGVHTRPAPGWNSDVGEWVRGLRRDKDVIVYLASHFGPSQPAPLGRRGAFAQAVLESRDVGSQTRLRISPGAPYTLEDLNEVIRQNVARLTRGAQTATYYVPETIPVQLPILAPPAVP